MDTSVKELEGRDRLRYVLYGLRDGKTQVELADELGVQVVTIARLATKKGLDRQIEMLELAEDHGWTLQEIGDKFGITKVRVYQLIGTASKPGSRGKIVSIDASEETWDSVMEIVRDLDLSMRKVKGVDTRAITQLLDGLHDGTFEVRRVKRKKA